MSVLVALNRLNQYYFDFGSDVGSLVSRVAWLFRGCGFNNCCYRFLDTGLANLVLSTGIRKQPSIKHLLSLKLFSRVTNSISLSISSRVKEFSIKRGVAIINLIFAKHLKWNSLRHLLFLLSHGKSLSRKVLTYIWTLMLWPIKWLWVLF